MRVPSVEFGEMRPARVQHVWVDTTGHWVDPAPGLLMMWRRRAGKRPGWDGWVSIVSQGEDGDASVREAWVDSRLIRPRPSEPPGPAPGRYRPVNEVQRTAGEEADRRRALADAVKPQASSGESEAWG